MSVKGPPPIAKEVLHHAHVTASKDIARSISVVLYLGTNGGIDITRRQHVLEFVKSHEHTGTTPLVYAQREVEALD